jgi:hypothetical protein
VTFPSRTVPRSVETETRARFVQQKTGMEREAEQAINGGTNYANHS